MCGGERGEERRESSGRVRLRVHVQRNEHCRADPPSAHLPNQPAPDRAGRCRPRHDALLRSLRRLLLLLRAAGPRGPHPAAWTPTAGRLDAHLAAWTPTQPHGLTADHEGRHPAAWIRYLLFNNGLNITAHTIAMWLTVSLAVFRYIAVCHPTLGSRVDVLPSRSIRNRLA